MIHQHILTLISQRVKFQLCLIDLIVYFAVSVPLICFSSGQAIIAGETFDPNDSRLVDAVERQDWTRAEALLAEFLPAAAQGDDQPADQRSTFGTQPDGMTPLHWAVQHGQQQWLKKLLEAGADGNAATQYQITPLSIAAQNGDGPAVRLLLKPQFEVNPNQPTAGRVTPLMLAARSGSVEAITALIDAGASPHAQQRSGQTALMWAAAQGHVAAIETLVAAGAQLETRLESGFDALKFACREGQIEAALKLIELGADVNGTMDPKRTNGRHPRKGMTPLMLAVESAHYELAIELVRAGADPNDESSQYAPLHALAWVRRPQKGDNPEGDPPPRGSGNVSSLDFVRLIIAEGADVNLQLRRGKAAGKAQMNRRGATPFLMAAQTVDLPLMKTLIQCGADPLLKNHDQCTALLLAAGVGNHHVGEHPGTVQEVEHAIHYLLELGLDLHAVDQKGETVMHGAAYRCYPEIVELLVSLGCQPRIWDHPNEHGWSPLKIAQGHRPGSFKPDPPTMAAIEAAQKSGRDLP